jgi:hypothetical protein
VVRHPLVQKIIVAYEKRDAERREASEGHDEKNGERRGRKGEGT